MINIEQIKSDLDDNVIVCSATIRALVEEVYAERTKNQQGYDEWASENIPQFFSGNPPTWEIVEANVRIHARNAWNATLAQRAGSSEANAEFADFCDRQGYPSDSELNGILYAAFNEGVHIGMSTAPPAAVQSDSVHSDDIAWDKFAASGKAKMAEKRAEGRGGWDNPEQCLVQDLATMLVEHVGRGDPVDISNFCMMIWNRVQSGYPLGEFDIITAYINCNCPKQPDSERDAALGQALELGLLSASDLLSDAPRSRVMEISTRINIIRAVINAQQGEKGGA